MDLGQDRWLIGPDLDRQDRFRFFCLPYAGGGAGAFRGLMKSLPEQVGVCAPELPGRGKRMSEPAISRMRPLVRSLVRGIEPALDRPFALFGHSMGALVSFELARALREAGLPQPEHLFVSAMAAPGTKPVRKALDGAGDTELKEELRRLNGTPRELLDNEELMELMLPTLRADFSVLDTYSHEPGSPLDIPVTVLGGLDDRTVPRSTLRGWNDQSSAPVRTILLEGDHFFLHRDVDAIAQILVRTCVPDGEYSAL